MTLSSAVPSPAPILTAAQMRACDRYTMDTLGVPSRTLMERAARGAVALLREREDLFPEGRVVLLCGSGNNGGDGFAMARFLREDPAEPTRKAVAVYLGRLTAEGEPDTDSMSVECARQYGLALEAGVPVVTAEGLEHALEGAAAVVDAVFGTGLDRPLADGVAHALTAVAEAGLPVLAVDIPSGIHADTGRVMGVALPAVATVTMQALKAGLLLYPGADFCGEITVCDLGISLSPAERPYATLADGALLRRVLPPRRRRTHKGSYGLLALLCGSAGMSGAAVLATRGALRSGVGLARVLTPPENRVVLQTAVPEAIVTVYGGEGTEERTADAPSLSVLTAALAAADGVVLGCGLGTSSASLEALEAALGALPADGSVPVVLDADGLNLLAAHPALWDTPVLSNPRKRVVLTPHPAEMARLTGRTVGEILSDLPAAACGLARERGVTVVLKDAHTVVASPDGDLYLCAAGNAGLAKGGSGDALAGILGSLLTQSRHRLSPDSDSPLTVSHVAAAGVFLHAAAADAAAARLGEYALLATDVIEALGEVTAGLSDSRTRISRSVAPL